MKKFLCFIFILTITSLAFSSTIIVVVKVSGKAFVRNIADQQWTKCYPGQTLDENYIIKTDEKSKVELLLFDGTKIVVSEKTEIVLSKVTPQEKVIQQKTGKARFKVSKLQEGAKFETITPTAIMSVRGTEFSVFVKEDLSTEVKVFEGIVNVKTLAGESIDLSVNEKIEILPNLPLPEIKKFEKHDLEETKSIIKEEMKDILAPEVQMDMTKEQVQRAAAEELKLAEYQQGKSLIDVWGNRVRIEEYIVRKNLQPNQFKMVVLNERENRFDYFIWLATFNKELPTDLTLATKWLSWKGGATLPEYYLKESYSGASNTIDKVEWRLTGDVVKENSLYEYQQNLVSYKINNNEKINLIPDTMTVSYPKGNKFSAYTYSIVFKDNTWAKESYYWIDNNGVVPSKKDFVSNGLLNYNQELVFEASEFEGRIIDLVVEPKIFVDAGIIK
jgi:uncharacterized protein YlzI (FlbEa/FlbD family)